MSGNKSNKNPKKGPSKQPKGSSKHVSAPAAVGSDGSCSMSWTPSGDDGGVAEGREFLASVVVPDDEVVGANNAEFYISPGDFGGTRLSLKAQEYQKFKFLDLEFEFCPATGSETPGSLVFAYDRDIATPTPPASEQGLRQYMAYQDAKHGNVWLPHTCKCPVRATKDMLWCNPEIGGDDRLGFQGQFFVGTMVPTGLDAGTILGSIIIKYRCEFRIAQLENEMDATEAGDSGALLTGLQDFLALLATPTSVQGDGQYLPRLQGDGTWGLRLQEGTYRFLQNLDTVTYTGAGTATFNTPLIEELEPSSNPLAPSASVTTIASQSTDGTGGNPIGDYIVTVPRGGGTLRSFITFSGTLAASAASFLYNIYRMGSFVNDVTGIFTLTEEHFAKMNAKYLVLREQTRSSDAREVVGQRGTVRVRSSTTSKKCRGVPMARALDGTDQVIMTCSKCKYQIESRSLILWNHTVVGDRDAKVQEPLAELRQRLVKKSQTTATAVPASPVVQGGNALRTAPAADIRLVGLQRR